MTLKYVVLLLRADNQGEGGILSLMALAMRSMAGKGAPFIIFLGMAGASLFYGDAIITPAISVLSAIEGLKLITNQFKPSVLNNKSDTSKFLRTFVIFGSSVQNSSGRK